MTWDSAKPRDLSLVSGVKRPFGLECGVNLPALSGGTEVCSVLGKVLQWRTEKGSREERLHLKKLWGEMWAKDIHLLFNSKHVYVCTSECSHVCA